MSLDPAVAPRVLLLGLGNDLLSDDAIGLRVAAEVRERIGEAQGISVLGTTEMGLSLLDLVVGHDELIIVDAIQTGAAAPGFLHDLDLAELKTLPAVAPHFLGVGEMLALGRELGMEVPQRTRIFAVEVADPFTLGTQLTPPVESALPGVVDRVVMALTQEAESRRASTGVAN